MKERETKLWGPGSASGRLKDFDELSGNAYWDPSTQ